MLSALLLALAVQQDEPTPPASTTTPSPAAPAPANVPPAAPQSATGAVVSPEGEAPSKHPARDGIPAKRAIWIAGDFGVTRGDLGISGDLDLDRTAANGFMYAVAAGYRGKALRLGLRWRVQDTTEFSLWTFSAVAGYGFSLRPLQPIISVHVGYIFDQGIEPAMYRSAIAQGAVLPPAVDVKGLNGGLDLNAAYWATSFLQVGLFVGADVSFFSRARADVPRSIFGATPEVSNHPLYTDSATSLGLNLSGGIRGAFDIGVD